MRSLAAAFVAVLLSGGTLNAYVDLSGFTYEQLRNDSDVIAIVSPRSVRESTRKIQLPGPHIVYAEGGPRLEDGGFSADAVDTEFEVLTVLKGKIRGTRFTVLHLGMRVVDPGYPQCPVSFDQKGGHAYLLFLKRGKDGRLVFTSGDRYACVSVVDFGPSSYRAEQARPDNGG